MYRVNRVVDVIVDMPLIVYAFSVMLNNIVSCKH